MILKFLADNNKSTSLAIRFRKKRFELFLSLLDQLDRPINILDVGGTEQFWKMMGLDNFYDVKITLLNTFYFKVADPNFFCTIGDACNINFADASFDVVFSNSVIEHVGNKLHQRKMAKEVTRVGKRYFIQTPNKYFFLEPHFLFPFFQFLPLSSREFLVRRFKLGWFEKTPISKEARNLVESIKLLSKKDMLELFPGCNLFEEKILGFTKSIISYAGWNIS